MKVFKKMLVTLFVVMLFCSVASASDQNVITSENGEFKLILTSIKQGSMGYTLLGELENTSNKDWSMLILSVVFYDADNNLMDLSPLMVGNIKKGQKLAIKERLSVDDIEGYKKIVLQVKSGV